MEHCLQGEEEEVPFLLHCPKLFISALTGRNVDKIFPLAQEVAEASKLRIKTGQLNKFIGRAMQRVHPPMIKGKRLRIYYLAQVSIEPPTFVLFVNYPHLMLDSYQKYLINQFREIFPFSGVPLIFRLKQRNPRNRTRRRRITPRPCVPAPRSLPVPYRERLRLRLRFRLPLLLPGI